MGAICIDEIIKILAEANQEHPEHPMTLAWHKGERHVKLSKDQLVFIVTALETIKATSQMERREISIEINGRAWKSELELEAFMQKLLEKIQEKAT